MTGEGRLPGRVLFVFIDGMGIGPPDPDVNPFFRAELPTLRTLLGDTLPHLEDLQQGTQTAWAFPLDPLLGVEGLPQSGTGQTALLTGENAPAIYGRHFGPWVPVRLRPLLAKKNVLSRAQEQRFSCAFANAYPREFHRTKWAKRPAAPPLVAEAAGLLTRHQEALAEGKAVSSEIVNTTWRERLGIPDLPDVSPQDAGRNLARIANTAHLTFFAHYATDTAGHTHLMEEGIIALQRVDAFLGGILSLLGSETLLVLASDHGNIEDIRGGHTRNPTLSVLVGQGAKELGKELSSLTDVAGVILRILAGGS